MGLLFELEREPIHPGEILKYEFMDETFEMFNNLTHQRNEALTTLDQEQTSIKAQSQKQTLENISQTRQK